MIRHAPQIPRRQAGASIIEVLVAALLLSLGVMALATMQASASQMGRTSVFKQEAARLALDYAERVRANAIPASTLDTYLANTNTPYTGVVTPVDIPNICQGASVCTPVNFALRDVAELREQARTALPNGAFSVTQQTLNGTVVLDIWLIWQVAVSKDTPASTQGLGCPVGVVQSNPSTTRCLFTRVAL